MEGLLTPVSTTYKCGKKDTGDEFALVEIVKAPEPKSKPRFQTASTPTEALEILRNEPDHETLISTLRFLGKRTHDFDITSPSPLAAQLVHTLVSDTVPNYWHVFQASCGKAKLGKNSRTLPELEMLLQCLRSVMGLNAVLLSLKQQTQISKDLKKNIGGPKIEDLSVINLQLLQALLAGTKTIMTIWTSVRTASDASLKQKAVWNEFLALVGGGKILGIAAESEDTVNNLSKKIVEKSWVADGTLFSRWIAQNITNWAKSLIPVNEDGWKNLAELFSKSFRLGHTDSIIKEVISSMLLQDKECKAQFLKLVESLPSFDQHNFLLTILKFIPRDYLSFPVTTEAGSGWWKSDASVIAAAAGLVSVVVAEDESRKKMLVSWLTNSSGAGVGDGIAIRRAVLASLAGNMSDMESILDASLAQFGDQLYIRHTPTLQQDVHAQVLLLAAGYVHRMAPLRLTMMMRTGSHLSVVSNRLAASSARARFLGMCIGEALSSLVDKGDKIMDFKVEEMSTEEAKWYKSLINVSDIVGSLSPLKSGAVAKVPKKQPAKISEEVKKKSSQVLQSGSKIVVIEQIDETDEEGSEDDGLTPYAKPDSDAEDSDEDATLITRNKPTAPVYIRDLITYFRDVENYDRQKLALATAAPLIRRKANFGTEVSAHAEELATLLVGLQDKYEVENFQDMRIQGMIAVLVALPLKMGQWFSKTFFDGDYSISQRASVLTTLGLGARELGGFGAEDEALTTMKKLPSSSKPSFPSKTLPPHILTHYDPQPQKKKLASTSISALDTLTTNLSNTMIAPMAVSLADKLTGPSILKVRTFSTRMAVEASRKKPTTNALAQVVATGFFFPLTGRFSIHLKTLGSSSANITFHPYLLSLFLKTLSLLLHASGPNTLSLPQMTSEFWDLCLGLRAQSTGDVMVLEALLFAFLTILEVNADKRGLVEGFGRQMLETQEWVEAVIGRLGVGGSEEDERLRMLAAGLLVRIRENVEKYQALLLGDLASFR
ncbi:hypothetical protein WAI453_012244 [Rhynchosporium graminicola]|uniref:Related to TEL2 Protein involved in controlling telomere length and position effect n=1 Tax=Rhynchosporium graminicola TaxID=2792576 RepID=A0A1E1KXS2_9HELO|nr:related to TEL2 Protein involved in controlling telomere length and position effect [Rhynchosporium commune]